MDARNLSRGHEGALTSLVFPTYNPGPMLERTWRELMQFLRRIPGSWEVLFVCDGCTDGTPARLATLARAEAERVRVLTHTPNRGKGYAVRRGLEAAGGEWRLFTDVDLAYGFDDVLRVAEALQAGARWPSPRGPIPKVKCCYQPDCRDMPIADMCKAWHFPRWCVGCSPCSTAIPRPGSRDLVLPPLRRSCRACGVTASALIASS